MYENPAIHRDLARNLLVIWEIEKEASMKRFLLLALIVSLIGTMAFANGGDEKNAGDDTIVVGVSFSDYSTDRWPREAALLTELGQKAGVQVITQVANQDPKLQNDQIENMILQGADVLIIIAQDGDAAASAVDAAAAEGIPTIAYDRLIKSPNLSAYLSFDNVEVGRAQGRGVTAVVDSGKFVMLGGSPTDNNATLFRQGQMEVVQKLVDAGKVEIVADQWVENWDPANALKNMENILTAISNDVDAVVASNDGTALGALQAMKAQGLAGVVPISGQDATLAGCKSIVEGELTMTVFKDVRKLSPMAMDMAVALAKGESVVGLTDFTLAELTLDDSLKGSVPCLFLEVVQVDASNIYEEVILTGFQSYDEVYRDIPEGDRPPRP
jgi:D-xylose transport system substrate-binding protein